MKNYIEYDPDTGEIFSYGECLDETFSAMVENSPYVKEHSGTDATHYVQNGQVVAYSLAEKNRKAAKPQGSDSIFYVWSNVSKTWTDTRTLAELRRAKELEINEMRLKKNQTSFMFQGKEIQCDPLSMQDIMGINGEVSLTGSLPASFPGAWKTMDNGYVVIPDVPTWTQFYQAMVTRGAANFTRSQALKAYVNTLTDPVSIAEVNWDTVIPS